MKKKLVIQTSTRIVYMFSIFKEILDRLKIREIHYKGPIKELIIPEDESKLEDIHKFLERNSITSVIKDVQDDDVFNFILNKESKDF